MSSQVGSSYPPMQPPRYEGPYEGGDESKQEQVALAINDPLNGNVKTSTQGERTLLQAFVGIQGLCLILSVLSYVAAHTSTKIYWMKYIIDDYDFSVSLRGGLDIRQPSLWAAYCFVFFAMFTSICNFFAFLCLERRVSGFIPKGVSNVIPGFKTTAILTALQFFFNMLAFSIALGGAKGTKVLVYDEDFVKVDKGAPAAGMGLTITVFFLSFIALIVLIVKRNAFRSHKTSFAAFSTPLLELSSHQNEMSVSPSNVTLARGLRKRVVELEAEVEELMLGNSMERVERLEVVVAQMKQQPQQ